MLNEAIENLRQAFSGTRSAGREHFFGLYAEYKTIKDRRQWHWMEARGVCVITWCDAFTKQWGKIATVDRADAVQVLTVLLAEMRRLRQIKTMRRVA